MSGKLCFIHLLIYLISSVYYWLQELTAILRTEVKGDSVSISSSNSEGDVLMKIESDYQSKEEQFYRKLMVLNLLASVCEALGPSCIKSTENTLKFVRVGIVVFVLPWFVHMNNAIMKTCLFKYTENFTTKK